VRQVIPANEAVVPASQSECPLMKTASAAPAKGARK
jgi:hypothetical protein